MPDIADKAQHVTEHSLAQSLSALNTSVPEGIKGECEECGHWFPRIVRGLCGGCRDELGVG